MKNYTILPSLSGFAFSLIFFFLSTLSPAWVSAQCCNYIDSGQSLDTLPTFGVALGDLDGDGDLDAFSINAYVNIQIFFNNGSGMFTLNQTITPTNGEENNFGVHLSDIDGDNDLDAIVVPFYNSSGLKIYKNNGAGSFSLFQAVSSNLGARHAGIGDLDGDGDIDIFLAGNSSSNTKVFLNNGNGMFTNFSSLNLVNFGGSNGVALADVDGDSDLDAIVVSSSQGGRVLLNNGSGTFSDSGQTLGNTSDSYYTVAAGDLDKDGDADLAFGCMYGPLTILFNNGGGIFTVVASYLSSNYDMHMKLVDTDYDGDLDIFVSTYGSNGLEVWNNEGEANFSLCYQNSSPMPSTYSHGFDIGLINNDLYYDTFMGQFGSSGDKVFFGAPGFYIMPDAATICQGNVHVFPDGFTSDSSIVHISHFSAISGCDSNIITTLTVTHVNIAVTVNQAILTSLAAGAGYQWVDCNNAFNPIANAVGQSFLATVSGSYAVIVSQNGCSDTSVCYPVIVTGLEESDGSFLRVFPNPARDCITIDYQYYMAEFPARLCIIDAKGAPVYECSLFSDKDQIVLSTRDLADGIYMLLITRNNRSFTTLKFSVNQ